MTGLSHFLSQYATEIYKSWPKKSSEPIRGYLQKLWQSQPLNYNIRHQPGFSTRLIKSPCYGTESSGYLGLKIWELDPVQLKNAESLEAFKSGIKNGRQKSTLVGSVRHTFIGGLYLVCQF